MPTELTHDYWRIFDLSIGDTASQIAIEQSKIGLDLLSQALLAEDLPPEVELVALPEFSITRNNLRWHSGFGYGGVIKWQAGGQTFVPLDARPNCCGAMAFLHPKEPLEYITSTVLRARQESGFEDPSGRAWPFTRHNHFIAIYESQLWPEDWIILVHGCPPELKSAGQHRKGLYLEREPYWQRISKIVTTNEGKLHYLIGESASEYFVIYREAEERSIEFREAFAQAYFPALGDVLFNRIHQGIAPNTIFTGCYLTDEPVLIMGSDTVPACWATGCKSIADVLTRSGLSSKMSIQWECPVIPHGLGVRLQISGTILHHYRLAHRSYYCIETDEGNVVILGDLSDTPISYRDLAVLSTAEELGLVKDLFQLRSVRSFKI